MAMIEQAPRQKYRRLIGSFLGVVHVNLVHAVHSEGHHLEEPYRRLADVQSTQAALQEKVGCFRS